MTAKQIARMITDEHLEENFDAYVEEIKDYAKQKCKEQREICAKESKGVI
jgi:hypothetical protein